MANRVLKEAGFSLGKVTGASRWRARIIKPGQGSSGFYTEDGIRTTGPEAFPIGTKINADHQGMSAFFEQPAGSVTTLIGAIATTPEWSADDPEGPGLYSEVEFSQEWAPFVEQFAPILGLSIQAYGYGEGETADGQPIIEGLIPHPLNTVDLVTVAGAGGKLIELAESFKGTMPKFINENRAKMGTDVTGDGTNNGKDNGMTPEEITALKEALASGITDAIKGAFAELKESLAPAPKQTEDEPQAPEMAAVVEAVVEAQLPKIAREKVLKAVEGGAKVEDAISAEKAYIKQLEESLKPTDAPTGKVTETGAKGESFAVGGWSV